MPKGELREQDIGYLACGIDGIRIGMLVEDGFEAMEEGIALVAILDALLGKGQQLVEVRLAKEQTGGETGVMPLVTSSFRHFEGGALSRVHAGGVDEGLRRVWDEGRVHGRDGLLPVSTTHPTGNSKKATIRTPDKPRHG